MRLGRNGVWHVVHETKTGIARRACHVICRPDEALAGEVKAGVPTCAKCLQLDDPTALPSEAKQSLNQGSVNTDAMRRLIKIDYIDSMGNLTRRGRLIWRDFDEEPAPWPDKHGVAHRRLALSHIARCGLGPIAFPEPLTTERYGSLREIALAVTCLFCARIP